MYLRDLAVSISDAAVLPEGRTAPEFNTGTHTPVEAYLDLLPRRKVVLGDLAKVNVVVGPRRPGDASYFAALNVAVLYWPWFDFDRYFALPKAEQQLRIVHVLHKALLRIARRTASSPAWFEAAYSQLLSKSFPLPELSEFELRRRWGLLSPREKRALKRPSRKMGRPSRRSRST
jgi:hypothetical protein